MSKSDKIIGIIWVSALMLAIVGLIGTMVVGGISTACFHRPEGVTAAGQISGGYLLASLGLLGTISGILVLWRNRRDERGS